MNASSSSLPPEMTPLLLVCGSLAIATVNSHQNVAKQARDLVTDVLKNRSANVAQDREVDENLCRQIEIFSRRWYLLAVFHMALYMFLAIVSMSFLRHAQLARPFLVALVLLVGVTSIIRIYELYLGRQTFELAVELAQSPYELRR